MPTELSDIGVLLTQAALRVVAAIILWGVGRLLIKLAQRLTRHALEARRLDPTGVRYVNSGLAFVLNVMLILALLNSFGIQTTGFAALIAGIGVAIGAAVSGLLAHFAAGLFMLSLRPFKVGDMVTAAGVTGTVIELGLLHTKINTLDNVLTMVGNNMVFSTTIQNFSANPYRRVLLPVQGPSGVDHRQAIALLEEAARNIPNALAEPPPSASITEFRPAGPLFTVVVYTSNDNYVQVLGDGYRLIRETFSKAGIPIP